MIRQSRFRCSECSSLTARPASRWTPRRRVDCPRGQLRHQLVHPDDGERRDLGFVRVVNTAGDVAMRVDRRRGSDRVPGPDTVSESREGRHGGQYPGRWITLPRGEGAAWEKEATGGRTLLRKWRACAWSSRTTRCLPRRARATGPGGPNVLSGCDGREGTVVLE